MADFTPLSAAIGGALIGMAAVLLMVLIGRISGISGIVGGLLSTDARDKGWRIAFLAGLVMAPLAGSLAGYSLAAPSLSASWPVVIAGGLLVGFGTRMASGCTSGHGVCGIARLSPRSIVATVVFMVTAMAVVAVTRHGFGG
jgi:uncharacterized membrane protein YedE/YeeE